MNNPPEHNPKQGGHTKPTIEEIKKWNEDKLVERIEEMRPGLLRGNNLEKFKEAFIDGDIFVDHAGDIKFFEIKCKLPIGISERLAKLAREVTGGQTAGIKRNRQRTEDAEMSGGPKRKRQRSEDVELSYSQSFASPELEGDLILGPYVSRRPKTVTKLAELLDDQWVVHVRGTPATGKTTLAYLLREYYQKRGNRVVLFSRPSRPSNVSLAVYLAEQCEKEGYYGLGPSCFTEVDMTFIIDEAQTAYTDKDLWEVIKSRRDQRTGAKFCLFTVYGSPSQGIRTETDPTPDPLRSVKQVSILRSHREDSPDIRLFYDKAEFEDVLTRYCAHPGHKLPLEKAARTYLYSITNGHPGAVISMLLYLYRIYGEMIRKTVINLITADDLLKTLTDDALVFSSLTQSEYPVHRSFPVQARLTAPAKNVLSTVCRDGSVPFKYDDDGMKRCFREGWIHVDVADEKPPSEFCFLPSRLHEKYIEYFITSVDPTPFPHDRFPRLDGLCMAVLKRFSKKSLSLSSAERRPAIAAPRPLEAQYQDEFYRAFTSLLGTGVGISSEWSRDNRGRVDFRILGPKWGVELLRDGTKNTVDEHYERFLPGGKYYKWISDGFISDWLVIDCRCSTPEEDAPPGPNLWHAVFAEDYSTLRILGADNQEIMSEVFLMG